ncbi:DUF2059 domain-containing protein [Cochleicola gelatinilyticus]|uniref:DUF2059 domain-containing protein n=1 Tax=Cochleicola gelatinilyticus TaxID=1763537 RepID=A0A167KDZ3_9FLAO|nr:DUF2059 domain-containing protein [Cochleicola gelatinilyticus]OAB81793.1 hypothetical protein ULVI_00185 [Cochleicola gelatinilyticus]
MKIRSFFLTLFCALSFTVSGQEDAFQQDIVKYLSINGTTSQYDNAYDQMLTMLQQQFADSKVPPTEWQTLKNNKAEAVGEVLTLLASAYRKHFSENDIAEMIAFYESDAAQKMLFDQASLSEAEQVFINSFYNSEVGKKIKQSRQALATDISQISEYWSRDLFTNTIDALAAKGFTPGH